MINCFSPFAFCSLLPFTVSHWFMPEQPSGIAKLPDEIMLQIFASLSIQDLAAASLVCRRWQRISLDDQLWLNFYQKYFDNLKIFYIFDIPEKGLIKKFFISEVREEKLYRIMNDPQLLKTYGIPLELELDKIHIPDLLTSASEWQKRRFGSENIGLTALSKVS